MFGRPTRPRGPYYDTVASIVAALAAVLLLGAVVYWSVLVVD